MRQVHSQIPTVVFR